MIARLLYVVPPWKYPGLEHQLLALATELPRDQFEPLVLLLGSQTQFVRQLQEARVPFLAGPHWPLRHLGGLRELCSMIRCWDPDLIHVWGATRYRSVWLTATLSDAPVIVTDTGNLTSDGRAARLVADFLCSRSHAFVSGFQSNGTPPAWYYETVRPGVPAFDTPPVTQVSAATFRHELGLPQDAQLAGVLNPLEPKLGIKDAIWAADLLKVVRDDFHLLILGTGSHRWRLERFVRQTRTGDRVHFVTDICACQLLPYLSCLWQTSHQPTNPYIVMLAMAHGIPVIATDLESHRRIVLDQKNGFLVSVGNRSHFARRTEALLTDHDLRQNFSEAAKASMQQDWPAQALVDDYAQLYRSCVR